MSITKTHPDQDALRRVGQMVRKRLAANSKVQRVDTDRAEIFAVPGFFSATECQQLLLLIDLVARPSELYDGTQVDGFRTSYSGDLNPHDALVSKISSRIDDLLGLKAPTGEAIQGQRYQAGQQFKPHHDFFHTDQPYWEGERKRGGQRSWTAMGFLNAVQEGGATAFTDIGIRIRPQPGVLLLWNNAKEDGSPNLDTLHAGTPVVAGTKYVITKWYRTRKWK